MLFHCGRLPEVATTPAANQRLDIAGNPCLVNEWHGYISSELFREYILELVALLKDNHANYDRLNLLADTRKFRGFHRSK